MTADGLPGETKRPSWTATPKRPDENQTGYAIRQIREHTAHLVLSDLRERLNAYDESCEDKACDCCSAWAAHVGSVTDYIDGKASEDDDYCLACDLTKADACPSHRASS